MSQAHWVLTPSVYVMMRLRVMREAHWMLPMPIGDQQCLTALALDTHTSWSSATLVHSWSSDARPYLRLAGQQRAMHCVRDMFPFSIRVLGHAVSIPRRRAFPTESNVLPSSEADSLAGVRGNGKPASVYQAGCAINAPLVIPQASSDTSHLGVPRHRASPHRRPHL